MKHVLKKQSGFALPTILIASVIMLIVLLSAITAVSSITGGLNSQYYNRLAREAAESGLARAETCLRTSNYSPTWTDAAPLKPETDCNGVVVGGYSKWVFSSANIRVSFTVNRPVASTGGALTIMAAGKVDLVRTSDPNFIRKTYSVSANRISRYNDAPQIASGAGFGPGGHNGYMLAASGVLYGWGDNGSNQLGDASLGTVVATPTQIVLPSGVARAKKVFNSGAGASILCVLITDPTLGDQVYCRGAGNLLGGPTWRRFALPAGLTAVTAAVNGYGNNTMCVLASNQQAYCAGMNYSGNLGNAASTGDDVDMSAPTKFRLDLANPGPLSGAASSLTVKKIMTQDRFTCVIASDDQAYCAGDNQHGQLGEGNVNTNITYGKSTPGRSLVPGNPQIDNVSVSYHGAQEGVFYHTVGAGIYMSGDNRVGTANDGAFAYNGTCPGVSSPPYNCYPTPRQLTPSEYPLQLSIGEEGNARHSFCVLTSSVPAGSSGVYCTGSNGYGQLNGTCGTDIAAWRLLDLLGQTVSTTLNPEARYQMNSIMVITTGGDVYSAGHNLYGKLGTGSSLTTCHNTFAKVQLPAGVKAVAIANGDQYSAYILGDNGSVYSMGYNNVGQLGDGTTTNRSVPVEVKLPRQQTLY